jgi:signal transduction histidine kinase
VPVNLRNCLKETIELLRHQWHAKGVEVVLESGGDGVMVLAEPVALTYQVLANLIGDAIKSTPDGKRVYLTVRPPVGDRVEARIRNEGAGMPPSVQETGSASGLSIARDFLHLFGATMETGNAREGGMEMILNFKKG